MFIEFSFSISFKVLLCKWFFLTGDTSKFGFSSGHVADDLRVDQSVGIDAPEEIQMIPVLIGDLVVVIYIGQSRQESQNIL